ncbi:MAG: LuxR family transcriptional regulator [Phyllobacteriaceae bacterium]|nr:LuxR family transcriptional regulator [Phyllobacteriaceae bacterium]
MNQHVSSNLIGIRTPDTRSGCNGKMMHQSQRNALLRRLRDLCALAGCHYGMVHRLGPHDQKLARAGLLHNIRGLEHSALTTADLLDSQTIASLKSGMPNVSWKVPECRSGTVQGRFLARLHIAAGLSVPFHNALGGQAVVTFCDAALKPGAPDDAILLAGAQALAFSVMEADTSPHSATELSVRERDCLQWAAAGKTALDTALILQLSPHTVSQYLATAMVKLGAVNRVQAVAKAIRLGLLDLTQI